MTKTLLVFVASTLYTLNAASEGVSRAIADQALARHAQALKTDDRVGFYESLVKAQPAKSHYKNLLAATLLQKQRETNDPSYLDRAAKLLTAVLVPEPGNYEALRLRSEVELERHNFRKVVEDSRALIERGPDDPWNWGTLGDALVELGQYDKAAEAYQKMVSLRPDLASYSRAAWFRFLSGDSGGAIEIVKTAIAAGSSSVENTAWCLVELGHLYFKSGRARESEQAYSAALAAFPNYHPALAGLGRIRAGNADPKPAIELYRKAQAITPLAEYAGALHDLYSRAGDTAAASRQMEMVELMDRMSGGADRTIALIYADSGRKLARALELAESEVASRPDIYSHDALAWALHKNGRHAEAAAAMKNALRMGTPEPMFHHHAGMIAHALGDAEGSMKHLRRALELNPHTDPRHRAAAEKILAELSR